MCPNRKVRRGCRTWKFGLFPVIQKAVTHSKFEFWSWIWISTMSLVSAHLLLILLIDNNGCAGQNNSKTHCYYRLVFFSGVEFWFWLFFANHKLRELYLHQFSRSYELSAQLKIPPCKGYFLHRLCLAVFFAVLEPFHTSDCQQSMRENTLGMTEQNWKSSSSFKNSNLECVTTLFNGQQRLFWFLETSRASLDINHVTHVWKLETLLEIQIPASNFKFWVCTGFL